jgi:CRISPR-associated protein Csy2
MPAEELSEKVVAVASKLRLAGGSLIPDERSKSFMKAEVHQWPGTDEAEERLMRRLKRRLMPGFALVSRETLLEERHREMLVANSRASMLDAFLDLSRLNIDSPTDAEPEWHVRRNPGWIVPISTGFQSLSELYPSGVVKNVRDRTIPFRFVEGIYTVGEWKSPHRIQDLRHILWTYVVEPDRGVYRCTTPHFATISSQTEGN